MVSETTPVIVGVGQFTERLNVADYRALSAVDIAAQACQRAIADAQAQRPLEPLIDALATTRTFEDSMPAKAHPFGKSKNFPRSIAARLGITPRVAVWDRAGGDSPQRLVSELCGRIASGELRVALLAGSENISTARALVAAGKTADWSESVDGAVDDRGMGLKGMMTQYTMAHRVRGAPASYGLLENARRARLKMGREAYSDAMGRLFAPFTRVAAENPYAAFDASALSAAELTEAGERNRMIADPYPQRLVARDQVNQGAAVVLMSVAQARELGISEDRWVYLQGWCDLRERDVLERADLGRAPSADMACREALRMAELRTDDLALFDFYSCFPIAVSNVACDGLGLPAEDARGWTVTGGLPYFGGPGNNYAMHAIASMVERLRERPGAFGLVGANGGHMSKYSAGVYSTRPREWVKADYSALQAEIDAWPAPELSREPQGRGTIETYTIVYEKGQPAYAIVVGRLEQGGARFLANTLDDDAETLRDMLANDPLGRSIHVASTPRGNRFAFDARLLDALQAKQPPALRDDYANCLVRREGHLLEVTINRPDARNSLTPMANDELSEIFDAFEADPNLWVAILTGAGSEAFCTGADLKYNASGKPIWIPRSGFAGLTSRRRTKPVIAAVNGFAMGGGTETCLACDVVVAEEQAQFALSEVKVGVIAGAGGIARLPRQIPRKLAVELILTGRKFSAHDAQRYGMINRVVPRGGALAGAREIAAEILQASPTAVRLSMRMMNDAESWPDVIDAVRNRAPEIVDELFTSEDFFEGSSAFAQKRPPVWKNR